MRLPPIRPRDLNPLQRALYDDMTAAIATGFNTFKTMDEQGALIGPWNASIHYPEVGRASWAFTNAVNAMDALPPGAKEVAILVVGGFYKAAYEIYAHTAVAASLGMQPARIAALVANTKPMDLSAVEAVVFDVAYALCRGGPLSDASWRAAVSTLGASGAVQLIYLIGIYSLVSVSLNGFDVPIPD